MIRVWGRTNSINVQKVMWTIGELGLEYERTDAGGAFGGLDGDDYGTMNPNRRIPVLKDGETIVWESQSCVRYLAACYGDGGMWPSEPGERSYADRWMDWQITTLHPQLHVLFWGLIRTAPEYRDLTAIERAAKDIQPIWAILDDHLASQSFITGERLTMGDVPLGCAWWRYRNLGLDNPNYPCIEAWYSRLEQRPSYREHVMIKVT